MGIGLDIIEKLKEKDSYTYIKHIGENGELTQFIPEMSPMKEVGECKYHVINCFDHSLYALEILEEIINNKNFLSTHLREATDKYINQDVEPGITKLQLLKLGVLFHDIGKPKSKTIDSNGRIRFRNHENIGADISLDILKRFELTSESEEIVKLYVKHHMVLLGFYKSNDMGKSILDNVFDQVGQDIIGLLLLGYADIVSTRILLNPNEDFNVIKTYMEYAMTDYIYRYCK